MTAPGKKAALEVRLERETVWLSLTQMASLFARDKSVISRHLKNVFSSRELSRKSVVAENATTATDGKTYKVECYNLDAICDADPPDAALSFFSIGKGPWDRFQRRPARTGRTRGDLARRRRSRLFSRRIPPIVDRSYQQKWRETTDASERIGHSGKAH